MKTYDSSIFKKFACDTHFSDECLDFSENVASFSGLYFFTQQSSFVVVDNRSLSFYVRNPRFSTGR